MLRWASASLTASASRVCPSGATSTLGISTNDSERSKGDGLGVRQGVGQGVAQRLTARCGEGAGGPASQLADGDRDRPAADAGHGGGDLGDRLRQRSVVQHCDRERGPGLVRQPLRLNGRRFVVRYRRRGLHFALAALLGLDGPAVPDGLDQPADRVAHPVPRQRRLHQILVQNEGPQEEHDPDGEPHRQNELQQQLVQINSFPIVD